MACMNTSDLLRCPITMEILHDPVLTPDGHTYERQAIEQWIRTHGTNPMTRQPLSLEQLSPNRIIKQLIDGFETSLQQKNYQFILDVDVRRKKGRPIFMTDGKTIYGAEWMPTSDDRPEIVLLKIDGARAKREASFYVNLSRHPHIIRTFGFVCDRNNPNQDNSILLLQEYASEGSLYELLQDRRTAPDEKVLIEIFLQIIDAMICLASNNVIHGDLACRNVLVFRFDENQPERNIVKITDFGLSRHSQLYLQVTGSARTALNIIPVRYAAPEIFSSNVTAEDYTEKSDVYSMGVLMWEAYSRGSIPWTDVENDNDVISRVRNGDLLPQPRNCSHPIWSIIKKTWSRLPNDRPTFQKLKRLLAAQYYQSGTILHNSTERYDININYNFAESNRKEVQRRQEEQDRQLAQRLQEEDRKLVQQQKGYREYAQQQQAKYDEIRFQQEQQEEQDRIIAQILSLDRRPKEQRGFRSNAGPKNNTSSNQRTSHHFSEKQLDCGGHACSKCGKCCDWRYDGPRDYWYKIRNWSNWTLDDWMIYFYEDWRSGWNRRFEGTCVNCELGAGAHKYVHRRGTTDDIARARRRYPQYFDKRKDLKNVSFICGYDRPICVCEERE